MGGTLRDSTVPPVPDDRLDSWKEIAAYLNRDVTTVQRWEKREGMPVHRHVHAKAGSVYAFRTELEAWARSRKARPEAAGENTEESLDPSPSATAEERGKGRKVLLLASLAVVTVAIAGVIWAQRTEYFWRNPINNARMQGVTDFDGVSQAAAVSRDGQFIAFLSDHDGPMDVWVTQVGSGQFHNLTHGTMAEIVNPSVRALSFSPDGSQVLFWMRRKESAGGGDIGIWSVATLGGQPQPSLEGVAELDWSHDGARLAYHTPGPGDPLFLSSGGRRKDEDRPLLTAPAGLHCHFPTWSPDGKFIYFVQGTLPDQLDIWRIAPTGGVPERITSHNGKVTYPVLLDRRTLLYLASDADGSGPWLYEMDVERRIPHRLNGGLGKYTSLAASADGKRLAVTIARPKKTMWRLKLEETATELPGASRVSPASNSVAAPRLGPGYLLYLSTSDSGDSLWKTANGASAEVWTERGARVVGGPAVSNDGQEIAFSVAQSGKSVLYAMRADGTELRVLTDALELQGDPAWAPDGKSVATAAMESGVPHLFQVPVEGPTPAALVREHAVSPVWDPSGKFVIYSGPDVGTHFTVKASNVEGTPQAFPELKLTRGARHLVFLAGGRELVFLSGEIRHKNLWKINVETGERKQLTNVPADFDIEDFDISRDGREIVLERVQERSEAAMLERPL
jgi:Tol biopolymer transport system component